MTSHKISQKILRDRTTNKGLHSSITIDDNTPRVREGMCELKQCKGTTYLIARFWSDPSETKLPIQVCKGCFLQLYSHMWVWSHNSSDKYFNGIHDHSYQGITHCPTIEMLKLVCTVIHKAPAHHLLSRQYFLNGLIPIGLFIKKFYLNYPILCGLNFIFIQNNNKNFRIRTQS